MKAKCSVKRTAGRVSHIAIYYSPLFPAQQGYELHVCNICAHLLLIRLVSEKTVEENILKKANQKRMLGDVAIEGGNFTTASLQQVGLISSLRAESVKSVYKYLYTCIQDKSNYR